MSLHRQLSLNEEVAFNHAPLQRTAGGWVSPDKLYFRDKTIRALSRKGFLKIEGAKARRKTRDEVRGARP